VGPPAAIAARSQTARGEGHEPTSETSVRELDHRTSDGIDVRLLWNSDTGRVSVAVEDPRFGESFELAVDAADALNAFRHPYVYANHDHSGQALAA
jgi:hypothetical protein